MLSERANKTATFFILLWVTVLKVRRTGQPCQGRKFAPLSYLICRTDPALAGHHFPTQYHVHYLPGEMLRRYCGAWLKNQPLVVRLIWLMVISFSFYVCSVIKNLPLHFPGLEPA